MKTGDRVTYRHPISGRLEEVTLLERVRRHVGSKFVGYGYTVRNAAGVHWTMKER